MADSKISALSAQTTLASTDMLVVANSGSTTKKITGASLLTQMPGYEFHYKAITAPVTVAGTTEGSPTTIITCDATTFDGSPVICAFDATISFVNAANATVTAALYEGGTIIARLATLFETASIGAVVYFPVHGEYRFTPTAASHTYTIGAWHQNSTSSSIQAGAGGTSALQPAFARFTKV